MKEKRDHLDYLQDILSMIEKVEEFTEDLSLEEFEESEMVYFAVIRALEVMGEAAKQVPTEVKRRYPEVPWSRMAGMRDKMIHGYFGVDLHIVWETATRSIPNTIIRSPHTAS
ncbi:HepT-like ribonuclease domain-containing protein [Methanothrix harundinacea]|nr:DUF86 domain-containing protein [Methanothrix harundinacea]